MNVDNVAFVICRRRRTSAWRRSTMTATRMVWKPVTYRTHAAIRTQVPHLSATWTQISSLSRQLGHSAAVVRTVDRVASQRIHGRSKINQFTAIRHQQAVILAWISAGGRHGDVSLIQRAVILAWISAGGRHVGVSLTQRAVNRASILAGGRHGGVRQTKTRHKLSQNQTEPRSGHLEW